MWRITCRSTARPKRRPRPRRFRPRPSSFPNPTCRPRCPPPARRPAWSHGHSPPPLRRQRPGVRTRTRPPPMAQVVARLELPRPIGLSQVDYPSSAPVIGVDRVGILADLYALADLAFVCGGSRRTGLHSVLEPSVSGGPVAVGPH